MSAVLQFGNLQFKQERNSDQAILPDNTVAQKISKLTGISVNDFTKALLKPKIKTGREFTVRSQNKAQVREGGRDREEGGRGEGGRGGEREGGRQGRGGEGRGGREGGSKEGRKEGMGEETNYT